MAGTRGVYERQQVNQPELLPFDRACHALPEDGRISTGVAVVAGATAVVLVCGVYFGKQAWDALPHSSSSPQGSRAYVKTLDIVPVDYHCLAQAAYDTSGGTARTKYTFKDPNGTPHIRGGFGAKMEKGKVVQDSCISPDGVKITLGTFQGRPVQIVNVQTAMMRFNTGFSEPDTKVVAMNPPELQFAGGTIDVLSGVARASCQLVNNLNPELKWKCDAVNTFAAWKDGEQANLERSLRVAVLTDAIAKKCALNEWKNILAAETDTYRKQAVEQGGKPEDVILRPVDTNWKPTTQLPDFTRATRESLIKRGVITDDTKGSPDVTFESINCTPLSKPYQPLYPDK